MEDAELRAMVRELIRAEVRGVLVDAWKDEGGIKGQFAFIPKGDFPAEITPAFLKSCASEVAGEIA